MSSSTYSPIIFIGRDSEQQAFREMLQRPQTESNAQWILSIQGEGGIGKTQLLYRFIHLMVGGDGGNLSAPESLTAASAEPQPLPRRSALGTEIIYTPDPIDLYLTAHQTVTGLLRALAIKLTRTAPGHPFQPFFSALDRSFKAGDDTPDLEDVFIQCYRSLQADHIVLFFDTIELINSATQRFFQVILPQLRSPQQGQYGTLVIAAGRKFLTDFYQDSQIQTRHLTGLSPQEIRNYLQELLETRYPHPIEPEFVERVSTLSQGRPILVALTVDWLNYGKTPQELEAETPEEFERLMVQRIRELRNPEDQAILAMAHLKRRFDAGFLEFLLGEPREQAELLIQSLTQFSFIKSHYNAQGELTSCLLHDEMQRLINLHVWPLYDPEGDQRLEWSEHIQTYYDQLIVESKTSYWPLQTQILQQERLYYTLQANPDRGVIYWQTLHTQATPLDFQEALNQEVEAFRDRLDSSDRQCLDYAWAELAYERGQYREALTLLEALWIQAPLSRCLEGKIRQKLIYCYSHLDDYNRGIEIGLDSQKWFQHKLIDPTLPQTERINLASSFGESLNAIGWSYRQQDNFQSAIEYYEQSLGILESVPGTEENRASTKTNLGYLFHLMGKDREAIAHGRGALKLNQRLGNGKQEGLTQNVLGIIAANSLREQQAVRHFQAALALFEEIGYSRGIALVKVAYGRLYRQIGWYKVKPERRVATAAQSNYDKAAQFLNQAELTIQASSQVILAEIYNEKGTLLREQGDFAGAIDLYLESLDIAQRLGNTRFQADNTQDLSVAYYLAGDFERAEATAKAGMVLANSMPSPHLLGRSQRTLANVLFQRHEYEAGASLAFESYVNLLTLDRFSPNNSAAVKEMLNEEWLTWMTDDLLESIEDPQRQEQICRSLLKQWQNTRIGGRPLMEGYPGFGIVLEDLLTFLQID
ncbi:MAG: tetratricopeptide repeat protein [Prochlorotrichaceae cyanobacterium]